MHKLSIFPVIVFFSCFRLMMFKIAKVFTYSGVALSARPENFRSPLSYDERGWLVSHTMGNHGTSLSPLRLRLRTGSVSVIADVRNVSVSFPMVDNPLSLFTIGIVTQYVTGPTPVNAYIGIGSDSALTRSVGPVGVIRQRLSAELILGATRDFFNSTCIPGTIMTLNFPITEGLPVQVKLRNEFFEARFGDSRMRVDAIRGGNIMIISQSMHSRLVERIQSAGLLLASRPGMFIRCSASIFASLPLIELAFGTGSLVYHPEDYLEVDASGETCTLRVLGNLDDHRTLILDPLFIPDTNIRVTAENSWDICESVAIA